MPEELRHARWLLKEREEYLVAGPPRRRGHRRSRPGAGRADGRAHRGGARGAAGRRSRSSPTPRPTAAACATRPRTTSTRSWRRSRWCSSARWRRCVKGREQLQAVVEPLPAELPDEHTGLESMYEQRRGRRRVRPGRDRSARYRPLFSGPSGATGLAAILAHRSRGTDDPFHQVFSTLARLPGRSSMSALRIDVADLLTHPGARRPVHLEAPLEASVRAWPRIVEPVRLDLVLERVPDGIVARGELHARWEGECSTCLRELAADLAVGVGRSSSRPTRSRATRPTRSTATRSTSSSSSATPCVLELPLAPACADDSCAPACRAPVC